ncbi:hypothetical protein NHF46_03545 [Arthrobacter alpinus]|nr:hypothetical protein [Arthrobacter alpinus]
MSLTQPLPRVIRPRAVPGTRRAGRRGGTAAQPFLMLKDGIDGSTIAFASLKGDHMTFAEFLAQ